MLKRYNMQKMNVAKPIQLLTIFLLFEVSVFGQYDSDDFEDEYEREVDSEYPSIFHQIPHVEYNIPYATIPVECAKECFCPPTFPVSMYCDHRKLLTIPNIPAHIQHLYLQHNEIEAVPLESFVNATALREIDLSHNKIKSHKIDNGVFAKFAHLRQLHLHHNELEEIPFPLPRSLERLILGFNQISKSHSKALEGLMHLTMLDLCNNCLEDSQLKGIGFSSMRNLMQINLCNNKLESMLPDLPPSIMYLSLENNSISFIPDNYFHNLPNLTALRMSHNNLQEIPYNAFIFSNLLELNLGHNKLKQIFYIPRSLQHLYLEDNEIEVMNVTLMCPTIDPLNLSHLTYIRVDQNKLTAPISTYAFFCFPHVRSIYYGEQKISKDQQTQLRTPVFRRFLTPEEYEEAEDVHEEQDENHDHESRGSDNDNYLDPYFY
ncbi:osteomodulin isoform X1 [Python bivittatus]|uniref:Osteomodulin n=2 Tax=Python bivittatus TaxID=176946 RepID=A0A9F5IXR2_PYTBI|nr:osteomodulin isoform X1 [Python bivittatus]XP_025022679.1 osteomodulin isoform X1 [Python bivittatus]